MGKNILTRELLLKSVEEWNDARKVNPGIKPDLSNVDLHAAELRGADLSYANLSGVDLGEANLREADIKRADLFNADLCLAQLDGANLSKAILVKADLRGTHLNGANLRKADLIDASCNYASLNAANLSRANLKGVDLSDASLKGTNLKGAKLCDVILINANLIDSNLGDSNLRGANFNRAILSGVILSGATLDYTTFGAVDFSSVIGLDTLQHRGPSSIGIDTIYLSKGNIPEIFLRGCGMPDIFIEYVHSLTVKAFDYYSCFISYSTKDDDFARRIHNDLQASGVRCWFAPHDIQGGKKVLHQIEEAIRLYDKLLLILSPDSMNSNWVETEIINAIQKEKQQQKQVLFPISIAPFDEIKKWKRFDADSGRDLAREIREYHIPDFSRWGSDQDAYKTAFDRLLKDLKQ